jgi:hypothetical protein
MKMLQWTGRAQLLPRLMRLQSLLKQRASSDLKFYLKPRITEMTISQVPGIQASPGDLQGHLRTFSRYDAAGPPI